jgi:hypothetical protein
MNSRRAILILFVTLGTILGAAAQDRVNSLRDLVGARASSGETQMQQRGYSFVRTSKSGEDAHNYYRENRSGRCVIVHVNDGRYQSIVYAPNMDCNGGTSGGNWGNSGNWGNNSGDSGQYQILQARYGTEQRNIDVTARLKELASQDRTFRMGNSTFGTDPDPGRVKTLRIYTRGSNGQNRTFEYREGSVVDGSMFTGWGSGNWGHGGWNGGWGGGNSGNNGDSGQYQILQARYGTEQRNIDVTARLKELAGQDRTFRMGNSTFGTDPDPGRVKTLRIYTRGPNGQERMFEYREGSVVDGSMFTGWGSGNWGHGGWNGGWGR